MDKLKKLGIGNAEPVTKENAPVYREQLNRVIEKQGDHIDITISNETDTFTSAAKAINVITLLQADYDALTEAEIDANTLYFTI